MPEPSIHTPRYLTRFACLGPACEDHCCAGWQQVDVDVLTYGRYHRLASAGLGAELRQRVVPNLAAAAGPDDFALIRIPPGGCCPFFGPERLCAIQSALGESLLPATCDTFPRQATRVGEVVEIVGRLACPEVARLALLADDALDLVEIEPDRRLRERAQLWLEQPWCDPPPEADLRQLYHPIRARAVELLRSRAASLEARLLALGGALEALESRSAGSSASVAEVFRMATSRLPRLQAELAARPERALPSAALLERVTAWLALPGVPARYRRCLDRLRDGLRLGQGAALTDAERYVRGRQRLRCYLGRRPSVLEHALINQVYVGNFPFHPQHTFQQEHTILAARLGLLKLHLIGAALAEGDLSDALVVETVQAFDKYADSPEYWQPLLEPPVTVTDAARARVWDLMRD